MALGAVVALEVVARQLLPEAAVPRVAATGLLRTIEAAGLLWFVSRLPQGITAVGLSRERWPSGLMSGLAWSAAFAVIAAIAAAVAHFGFSVDPIQFVRAPIPRGLYAGAVFILVAGIVSPVAEEILFRGVLFSALRPWGAASAIIGTTLLFTAAHFYQSFPLIQCIGGLVFAIAMEKSRSLLTPITIHILGNLAIYTISLLLT